MLTEDQVTEVAAKLNEKVNIPFMSEEAEQGILEKAVSAIDDKLDGVAEELPEPFGELWENLADGISDEVIMSNENDHRKVFSRERKRVRLQERWVFVAVFFSFVAATALAYMYMFGATHMAIWRYAPEEGDIVFQSLPRTHLVIAIEGATASPYSHCGVVTRSKGRWVVLEAYRNVEKTPLNEFLHRGRRGAFSVYRLRPEHRANIEPMLQHAAQYLGRPYDARYRMDDEQIYCTELIFKAYRDASGGDDLGELVPLGDLHWRPFRETIKRYEGGPPPLERLLITPKHMARAKQLTRVYSHVFRYDHD